MKKSLFFVLAIIVMALTFGCQRNISNVSEDGIFGKSLLIVCFNDDMEKCYQLIIDSTNNTIKMDQSVISTLVKDEIKYGAKYCRVTADIVSLISEGYVFNLYDSINKIEYIVRIDSRTTDWVYNDEISFTDIDLNDSQNTGSVSNEYFVNPTVPVDESYFIITKSDFVIASIFFFLGFIVSFMLVIAVGKKRLKEEQEKMDKEN